MTDFSAAASALGWFQQVRSALILLLENEESELRLEGLDDIDLTGPGDATHLLQVKHRAPSAVLSDSSPDLWKTLRIWSTHAKSGEIDLDKVFLTLVTTAIAPPDSAAAHLRLGINRNEEIARSKLLSASQASTNVALKKAFEAFAKIGNDGQRTLLSRIRVLDESPDIEGARTKLEAKLAYSVPRDYRSAFVDRIEGWWFQRVIQHLRGSVASLAGREVVDIITDIAQQFHHDALPIDFYDLEPTDSEMEALQGRLFVQQLRCLVVSTRRIQKAVVDYYRAYAQRSRWARERLLISDELERYEEKLRDEWERVRLALVDELPSPAAEQVLQETGRKLLTWMESKADFRIREKVSEPYVMRGSYHMLADNDPPQVWWHPEFVTRIRGTLGE